MVQEAMSQLGSRVTVTSNPHTVDPVGERKNLREKSPDTLA